MKNIFVKTIRTLLLTCMFSASLFGANIIFDLGGVLLDTSKMAAFKQLGWGIVSYRLKGNDIKKKFFEILNKIDTTKQTMVKDHENDSLPKLMCNWMDGSQSAQDILRTIQKAINNNPEWFSSKTEQNLVKRMARMVFDEKHFVRTRKLIKNGVKFVKECKKQGHKCYILSNWNTESFKYMCTQKKYKEFFGLFDGILISGEHNCLKPHPSIYTQLIRHFKLNPSECVFIDDQKENIVASKQMGIHAIHCKKSGNPDFKRIQNKIDKWEKSPRKKAPYSWRQFLSKSWLGYIAGIIVFSVLITPAS